MIRFRPIAVISLILFSSVAKCHGFEGKESTVLVEVSKTVEQLTVNTNCCHRTHHRRRLLKCLVFQNRTTISR
jgi:hypothetical protein